MQELQKTCIGKENMSRKTEYFDEQYFAQRDEKQKQ